jgi:arylsulfatase A-like enzyme
MTGRLPIRSGTAGIYTPGVPPYKYQRTSGVFSCGAEFGLPLNETTVAQVLKANGYRTGMAGKCECLLCQGPG